MIIKEIALTPQETAAEKSFKQSLIGMIVLFALLLNCLVFSGPLPWVAAISISLGICAMAFIIYKICLWEIFKKRWFFLLDLQLLCLGYSLIPLFFKPMMLITWIGNKWILVPCLIAYALFYAFMFRHVILCWRIFKINSRIRKIRKKQLQEQTSTI